MIIHIFGPRWHNVSLPSLTVLGFLKAQKSVYDLKVLNNVVSWNNYLSITDFILHSKRLNCSMIYPCGIL